MSWFNPDQLLLKYGPEKTVPTTTGDYRSPGEDRTVEFDVDISKLTTTASILADTTVLPAGVFIDSVILVAETPATTITSLSIGLMKLDRTTTISDTALANAVVLADIDGAGETKVLTGPPASGGAGSKVGTTVGADQSLFTAKIAGSAGTGIIKVRVKYRGVGTITH